MLKAAVLKFRKVNVAKKWLADFGGYISIIGALCIFLLTAPVAAQEQANDKITPDEARQALAIGHHFAEDLVRYKNLAPLIPKYFLPGFERKLPDVAVPVLPEEIKRTPHVRRELKKFYIEQNNFILLTLLYQIADPKAAIVDNPDERASYPADVWAVIDAQNGLWNKLMKDGKFGHLTIAESNRYFDKSLRFFETINKRLRRHVSMLTPKSPSVQEYLKPQQMESFRTFDTWLYICDKTCYLDLPYPTGTRLIIVEMPFLDQLVLVRNRGDLRVVVDLPAD